jgi:hypothetical protein
MGRSSNRGVRSSIAEGLDGEQAANSAIDPEGREITRASGRPGGAISGADQVADVTARTRYREHT